MTNIERILEIIRRNRGYISTSEAVSQGIQRWYLSDMVKHGTLVRVDRGLYSSPEEPFFDDNYRFQMQYTKYIFSYHSALYYHGLTEKTPSKREVTAFKGYHPFTTKVDAIVHYVSPSVYDIGIMTKQTEFGNNIKVYDMERTICDLIDHRETIDPEIFVKAIKLYSKSPKKDTMRLYMYAEEFGIGKEVFNIFELI